MLPAKWLRRRGGSVECAPISAEHARMRARPRCKGIDLSRATDLGNEFHTNCIIPCFARLRQNCFRGLWKNLPQPLRLARSEGVRSPWSCSADEHCLLPRDAGAELGGTKMWPLLEALGRSVVLIMLVRNSSSFRFARRAAKVNWATNILRKSFGLPSRATCTSVHCREVAVWRGR